jgi:hypothetical protein
MSNLATCRFCKKKIEKVLAIVIINEKRNNYYCSEECKQQQLNKENYKSNQKDNKEVNDRKALLSYIQEQYIDNGIDKHCINWRLITANLKNLMDNDKEYKLTGILYCLKYMKEIEGVNLISEESNTPLALMPFYYEKSKQYWLQTKEIAEAIKDFEFNDEVKVIRKSEIKEEITLNLKDLI